MDHRVIVDALAGLFLLRCLKMSFIACVTLHARLAHATLLLRPRGPRYWCSDTGSMSFLVSARGGGGGIPGTTRCVAETKPASPGGRPGAPHTVPAASSSVLLLLWLLPKSRAYEVSPFKRGTTRQLVELRAASAAAAGTAGSAGAAMPEAELPLPVLCCFFGVAASAAAALAAAAARIGAAADALVVL